ncbi:LysR family transcriptional regulator [Palleronia aestuarii]|uniref:LysR family transcriptional regulator n=1 Tax=Palleronia aestuarii TaxID=568105 RepID=A0A2W7NYS7_9RHOB|nr:LysR family transcriptional regulator [Palleronia aestuarii]PZX18436.1 LysR family transcriptional regulator [Palleronia aestuarii]
MPKNLDLTALRSFVAVAEKGGVTRASGYLNLTQSAVSMQLKRLEESLGLGLIDRSARSVSLTATGEQLLSYARRMLDLNDEVMARMTDTAFEGEIVLGVPHDVIYPAIPNVLHQFATDFPRMRVKLHSQHTSGLKEMLARGQCDFILTTEDTLDPGGETLATIPLVWIGAPNGTAWRERPLRLAFCTNCIFRKGAQRALDAAGIDWEMAIESDSDHAAEATVAADLGVYAVLDGTQPPYIERVPTGSGLPDLAAQNINLYASGMVKGEVAQVLTDLLRQNYRTMSRPRSAIRGVAAAE